MELGISGARSVDVREESGATLVVWVFRQLEPTPVPTSEWLKLTGPNLFGPKSQRKALYKQAVWPVNFGLTGPICARANKVHILLGLAARGHHDWPVKRVIREQRANAKVEPLPRISANRFSPFLEA